MNDGTGLGFGIIGGKSTGVVVKTILPGGVADKVEAYRSTLYAAHHCSDFGHTMNACFGYHMCLYNFNSSIFVFFVGRSATEQ